MSQRSKCFQNKKYRNYEESGWVSLGALSPSQWDTHWLSYPRLQPLRTLPGFLHAKYFSLAFVTNILCILPTQFYYLSLALECKSHKCSFSSILFTPVSPVLKENAWHSTNIYSVNGWIFLFFWYYFFPTFSPVFLSEISISQILDLLDRSSSFIFL